MLLGLGFVMPWVDPEFRDAPYLGVAFVTGLALVAELGGAGFFVASHLVSREGSGRVLGLVAAAGLLVFCNPLLGGYVAYAVLAPEPAVTAQASEGDVDLHERAAGWVLLVAAAPLLALGVFFVPAGFLAGATAPEFRVHPGGPLVTGLCVAVTEGALFLGLGALPAAAGLGVLRRRDPAAWGNAVAVAGLLLVSGCFAPLGGWVLYGLARERTRARFGVR
jgi:hypothetical protein